MRLEPARYRVDPVPMENRPDESLIQHDQSQNILPGNRAVGPAVNADRTIITHDKILVFAAGDKLFVGFGIKKCMRAGQEIRFFQFLAIDKHFAVLEKDGIARHSHDALDRKPMIARIPNDHDIVVVRFAVVKGPAVEQVVALFVKRGHHADPDNFDRLQKATADRKITTDAQ